MNKTRWANKKIDIGGLIYVVKYRTFKPNPKKNIQIKAELDYIKRILWLQKDMPNSEEIQSLIHEFLHGINDALIPAELLDDLAKEEEVIVEPYSRLLCSTLRNAGLLKE